MTGWPGLAWLVIHAVAEGFVDETWGRLVHRETVVRLPSGRIVYGHERRRWPWHPWGPA